MKFQCCDRAGRKRNLPGEAVLTLDSITPSELISAKMLAALEANTVPTHFQHDRNAIIFPLIAEDWMDKKGLVS